MNYLAHLVLSPRSTNAIVGNLMGDFRRYVRATTLPEEVQRGIENHCRIDRFTDGHVVINGLKHVFSSRRRRFAGIILDVAFDHFLSRHWHRFHTEQRMDYIDYLYGCLHRGRDLMPPRMQTVVDYMIAEDWLGSYADLAGIETCLNRMSGRIRFENTLHGAVAEVRDNYVELERGFLEFFPQLVEYVNRHGLTGIETIVQPAVSV